MDISKSNYYKYYKQTDKDYDEYLLIKEIFDESKGTYGYRRIEKGLLQKWGLIMNHKKVQRIMKKYYIKPHYTKRVKNKTYKIPWNQTFQGILYFQSLGELSEREENMPVAYF